MAEHVLKRGHVASISEKIDCKRVAKAVRGGAVDAGARAGALDEFAHGVAVGGAAVGVGDEGRGGGQVAAAGEVFPQGTAGRHADVDDALFVALPCSMSRRPVFAVVVAQAQVAEFGDAQAGVEQDQDDGDVARGGRSAPGDVAVVTAVVGVHFGDGGEDAAHFVLGVWLHHAGVG